MNPPDTGAPGPFPSEDRLLEALRRLLAGPHPGVVVGPGDDAAVVEPGAGHAVLTTDLMVEGVHFDPATISARDLGAKAIAVNVSDIAAMAASPRYALVSLAVSASLDAGWVMELYGGMLEACREHALALVGGDLSRAQVAVISITVMGEAAPGRAVLRSGARAGDAIVVTGVLGASAAGLALLRASEGPFRDRVVSRWGVERIEPHFHPVARVGEGQTLAAAGATAMMDLSDGLALDLTRMCMASGVGCRLNLGQVPIAQSAIEAANLLGIPPLELALSGGEDYELLVTLPPDAVGEARRLLDERFAVPLTPIGDITESGLIAVDPDGVESPLVPRGWDHFAG